MDISRIMPFMSSLHYCLNASLIFLCFVRRRCLFPVHLPFRPGCESPSRVRPGSHITSSAYHRYLALNSYHNWHILVSQDHMSNSPCIHLTRYCTHHLSTATSNTGLYKHTHPSALSIQFQPLQQRIDLPQQDLIVQRIRRELVPRDLAI